MKEPVRILSDLHLGHKVSRIERASSLRPLIAGAGTVIFNGDTWEELASPFREQGAAMLAELQTLCAGEGADPVFLSGNHDPGWPGSGWVELAEGKIIVTHGDALFFDGSPWKREILTHSARVIELWKARPAAAYDANERLQLAREIARVLPSCDHSQGARLLQRAWDAATPPKRALRILEAWLTQARAGAEFCSRYFPTAEALVIGHFHRHGCWENRGKLVINTGSFMNPGRAHWVEYHQGWLTRGAIDETTNPYRLGETLDVWRF